MVYISQLEYKKGVKCEQVCQREYETADKAKSNKLSFLRKCIELNYNQHW